MLEPYYSNQFATIYHGDSREIVKLLDFDCIITDPPYGIGLKTNYKQRKRGGLAQCQDFPPIHGDNVPFDPKWLLDFDVPTVLFGANHFSDSLPASSSWLVWDKLDGLTTTKREIGFNDQADAELIWTNLGGPVRILRQRWMGALKSGRDARNRRIHPTQKPVELMQRIIGLTTGTVLDPYMGSGTTLLAAQELNRPVIGIEFEEQYCEIAANRLA